MLRNYSDLLIDFKIHFEPLVLTLNFVARPPELPLLPLSTVYQNGSVVRPVENVEYLESLGNTAREVNVNVKYFDIIILSCLCVFTDSANSFKLLL